MLLLSSKAGGVAGEGRLLVSTLLVRSLVLLLLSISSGSALVVVASLVRVDVSTVLRTLGWVPGDELQRLLDLLWDWWGSWQMSSNGTVTILVSGVGEGVVLAVVSGVREGALDGNSGCASDLLQLSLGIGLDSVSSLVAGREEINELIQSTSVVTEQNSRVGEASVTGIRLVFESDDRDLLATGLLLVLIVLVVVLGLSSLLVRALLLLVVLLLLLLATEPEMSSSSISGSRVLIGTGELRSESSSSMAGRLQESGSSSSASMAWGWDVGVA